MATLRVGTSGYAYKEWLGNFYPEKLSQKKMLEFYSRRFQTVEINYTFYHMPTTRTTESWVGETPEGFLFTLKGNKNITHIRRLKQTEQFVQAFVSGAEPLANAGRLGPILWQLPPQMRIDLPLLDDFLASLPQARPIRWAVEFRHASWFAEGTWFLLRKHAAALCVADTDEGCVPDEITAPFCYYRLRKTDYSDEEFQGWRERFQSLVAQGHDVFVYFKHEEQGSGPMFASRLLGDSSLES